jgi:calcium-dependent protein kinase
MFRRWGRGGNRANNRRENVDHDGSPGNHVVQDASHSQASSGASRGNHIVQDDSHSEASSEPTHSTCSSKALKRSASQIGLDEFIEARKNSGDFTSKMVTIEIPFGKPIEEVYHGVHDGKVLGEGVSGKVRLVTHKATGHKFAVKCLELRFIDSVQGLRQLREEIAIMCELDHPNIVRLEEVYESHEAIYLVQELAVGGELFDRLFEEQPDQCFSEAECVRMVKQMLSAVRYLHSKGIVHRDLKLENFLLASKRPNADLVLVDFGLSKHFKYGEVQREAVGTPYTVAPEVIRGDYDEKCDVWALGILSFILLCGDPPFGGLDERDSMRTIKSNILSGHFDYERTEVWSVVSDEAKAFVEEMLVTDPKNRPTAQDALRHPWLREWPPRGERNATTLDPSVVNALLSFKDISILRKLLAEVLSFTLVPDQLSDIRTEFEKLDMEGTGTISLESLKAALNGKVTDKEIEDMFNAMRVGRSDNCVHWHEFIAAALPFCHVDQTNMRLAFDRLDCLHHGCISLEDIMELIGDSDDVSKEAMQNLWNESLRVCNCQREMLTLQDFSFLLSGSLPHQSQPDPRDPQGLISQARDLEGALQAVGELNEENGIEGSLLPPHSMTKYSRRRCHSLGGTDEDQDDDEGASDTYMPLFINGEPFFPISSQMLLGIEQASASRTNFDAQRPARAPEHIVIDEKQDGNDLTGVTTAGLVRRHGARKRVDSDAARAWRRNMEKKQEALVRKANKRSGRGRNFSDISGWCDDS